MGEDARGNSAVPRMRMEPPDALQEAETSTRIREALSELPEGYREVILLKHVEGFSYRDIARALKTTVRAVESRLFRARQELTRILERADVATPKAVATPKEIKRHPGPVNGCHPNEEGTRPVPPTRRPRTLDADIADILESQNK